MKKPASATGQGASSLLYRRPRSPLTLADTQAMKGGDAVHHAASSSAAELVISEAASVSGRKASR
jgi:hypothetical protein